MYNYYSIQRKPLLRGSRIRKLLLVMKFTVLILITFMLHVSAATLAQTVTLHEKNAKLVDVFNDINAQTGYDFAFTTSAVKDARPVTIDVKDKDLKDVLTLILQHQNLEFSIDNKSVVIKVKEGAAPEAQKTKPDVPAAPTVKVTGKVTDSVGTALINATITDQNTKKSTITDDKGEFSIEANQGDVLWVTYVGYKPQSVTVAGSALNLTVALSPVVNGLKEVVVSNGYQNISAEKAVGAYDHIGKEDINRATGNNIIDRLDGLASGVQVIGTGVLPGGLQAQLPKYTANGISPSLGNKNVGLLVRGVSTLSDNVGTSPLIVLDNFPYSGDINNIDPNEIESITVLKDAAAASIWGARAGNGVIVMTTKQGRLRHAMQVSFNSNVTIANKLNVFKSPDFLDANDYINVETKLFNQGYYDAALSNTYSYPGYSPVVAILEQERSGQISSEAATAQINAYRNLDARNDIEKYDYQKSIDQQYSAGLNGGTDNMTYALNFSWDKDRSNYVGSAFNRRAINANSTYYPLKNLEVTTSINYSQFSNTTVGDNYSRTPYEMLADSKGNPLPSTSVVSALYADSLLKQGFLDWKDYPLNDLRNTNNKTDNNDILLRFDAKYKITNYLNIEATYQNETQNSDQNILSGQQTQYVTNLINEFSTYDPNSGTINYGFPLGDILQKATTKISSNYYRLTGNFNKQLSNNSQITALIGGEISQQISSGSGLYYYGYDPNTGAFNNNLDYTHYVIALGNFIKPPSPEYGLSGLENRNLSYFANLSYSYKNLYTFSLNGRKDGANIFGVNTNDKFNANWSVGGAWNINNEKFYQVAFLPTLKLRLSYGFAGNVYQGSAYVTGYYQPSNLNSSTQEFQVNNAPNPDLSWETVRTINLGVDFGVVKNIFYGSINIYRKDGLNLLEPVNLAPTTGFTSFTGNAANTKGKGLELDLNSNILTGNFKWSTSLIANFNSDILTKYDVPQTAGSAETNGTVTGVVGKPLYSIFGYKWAGLDPANGNPRGYLNGKISEDYQDIINNYKPDSLFYGGSAIPTQYGSWINNFTYQKLTLSVMIGYELGFVFRKHSMSGNYTDLINGFGIDGVEYAKAWQKPGDELSTNIPSLVYPDDPNRATFYTNSQALILNGDNIRLKNIRLDYDLADLVKHSAFSSLHVFSFASNLGLLWKANKSDIDPDYQNIPPPFTISFGLQATLK